MLTTQMTFRCRVYTIYIIAWSPNFSLWMLFEYQKNFLHTLNLTYKSDTKAQRCKSKQVDLKVKLAHWGIWFCHKINHFIWSDKAFMNISINSTNTALNNYWSQVIKVVYLY